MNRSKIVAILAGAISILLAIVYLILVQLLDFRGEMLPAPQELSVVNVEMPYMASLHNSFLPLSHN